MIEIIALYIGYAVMIAGGLLIVGLMLFWSANAFNRGVRWALEAYGGWNVFLEYREWYQQRKRASSDARH